jgi:hypothetical protein
MENKFGLLLLVILGAIAIVADITSEASYIRRLFR